jgi:hypothetical protein
MTRHLRPGTLAVTAVCVVLGIWSSASASGLRGRTQEAAPAERSAIPVAADRCVHRRTIGGRETLINLCAECRVVTVQHRRPGHGFPANRTFTVPGKSEIQMSFRGPGSTRVTSDNPCDTGADQTSKPEACGQFLRRADGSLVLVNACDRCRAVTVEREHPDNRSTAETLLLQRRSYAPLPSYGAARIRITGDATCP